MNNTIFPCLVKDDVFLKKDYNNCRFFSREIRHGGVGRSSSSRVAVAVAVAVARAGAVKARFVPLNVFQ